MRVFANLVLLRKNWYEKIGTLFQDMFLDGVIASKFKCGAKKIGYVGVFGLLKNFI